MTELMFPAGIVRIDEGHVWAELSRFAAADGGSYSLTSPTAKDPTHYCTLKRGGGTWRGSSKRGAADAVANALAAWARDPEANAGLQGARP